MTPLIGITANYLKNDQVGMDAHIGGAGQFWQALADDYVQSVVRAGGLPVILPILPQQVAEWLDRLDGILFSGGCDVSPVLYGAGTTRQVGELCRERDDLELSLLQDALARPGYPILCICRGCQLLNVALGGSLVMDIDTTACGDHFLASQRMPVPAHLIEVQEGSRIAELLSGERQVNSFHHQCADRLGNGVTITAWDSHRVPECLEVPAREGFTLGVQWHPEGMTEAYAGHLNIFKGFVQAAAEYQHRRDTP